MKTSVSRASSRAADPTSANNPSFGGSNRVRRRNGNQDSPGALLLQAWMPDQLRQGRLSGLIGPKDRANPLSELRVIWPKPKIREVVLTDSETQQSPTNIDAIGDRR
jgi:hypothetical protein